MHLFGAWGHRVAGRVLLHGAAGPHRRRQTQSRGLVLVTEDRKRYGLVLDHGVAFNLSLSSLSAWSATCCCTGREIARARTFGRASTSGLTGSTRRTDTVGRQPAEGRDRQGADDRAPRAAARRADARHRRRREARGVRADQPADGAGKAVVLVSSELPELMGMSDRILMLHEGRVGGVFARGEATQEKLLAAAMGRAGMPPEQDRV